MQILDAITDPDEDSITEKLEVDSTIVNALNLENHAANDERHTTGQHHAANLDGFEDLHLNFFVENIEGIHSTRS